MKKGKKELIVVGDRLLIVPDVGDDRSNAGLYLPRWALEKESVQSGRIVEIGPAVPMPDPDDIEQEPWKQNAYDDYDAPQQAQVGDYAIFMRKSAIEIKFDSDTFLIVPHGALLLLVRDI